MAKGYNLEQTGPQVQEAINKSLNLTTATQSKEGLMSAQDKQKLDSLDSELAGKVDKVPGKGLSTNDYDNTEKGKVASAYQKPVGGIPASDLAEGVIPDTSQFITKTVNDLANYYLKTETYSRNETYTKTEVDALIALIKQFTYQVVSELPEASESTMYKLYLVPSADPQTQNVKDEYITVRSGSEGAYTYAWEQIGSTAIDLSGYVTTQALNAALANYTTTANLTTLLAAKQDVISDLSTIRSGAAAGATAYQKPGTGIPKTDLESGVQQSLDLADSAIQAEPTGVDVPVEPSLYATKEEVDELEAKVDDISTGKYYGYYATASDLPEDVTVDGFAYVGSGPTYTIYNCEGGVWTSSGITVNQSPVGNDEDIDQNEDGKLQFANRVYNAQQHNGMGYKILRKDATFASQVTETNTIYEIRYDFTIAEDFTMPVDCVLQFNGGSIQGVHTLSLGNTICFGIKGLLCPIISNFPIRTSTCGIGEQWEADSSDRLSSLVNNSVKIIVDTNIICLSPVISNAKSFYLIGDYSNGYRRPAYTISFPNSDGFVLGSGQESATNATSWGHCFRNLNIVSDGHCINFWPTNHIAVFAENTFENLFLRSDNGDCVTFGDNYTSAFNTAGFNQYFRQIQAVANNGVCFRGIRSSSLKFQHITIYGSKDGGFYNCAGDFESVVFDQASFGNNTYGWRWTGLAISGATIHFRNCVFENLKIAIDADGTFNGNLVFDGFYSDVKSSWDDEGDGLKHFNHYSFGNAKSVSFLAIEGAVYGGAFASGYALYSWIQAPLLYGKGMEIKVGNYLSKVGGVLPEKVSSSFYQQLESGKNYVPKYGGAMYSRFEAETMCLTPLRESANDFTFSSGAINLNGVIGHSIILSNTRTIYGFMGYNPPFSDSANKIFEFFILNKSVGDVTLIHRNSVVANGSYCFNNFSGEDIILKPNCIAHCVFNGGQAKGDLVANKFYVDVVDINPKPDVSGSTRPGNPFVGQQFFDATLGKPVWYAGNSTWVDATGATV